MRRKLNPKLYCGKCEGCKREKRCGLCHFCILKHLKQICVYQRCDVKKYERKVKFCSNISANIVSEVVGKGTKSEQEKGSDISLESSASVYQGDYDISEQDFENDFVSDSLEIGLVSDSIEIGFELNEDRAKELAEFCDNLMSNSDLQDFPDLANPGDQDQKKFSFLKKDETEKIEVSKLVQEVEALFPKH